MRCAICDARLSEEDFALGKIIGRDFGRVYVDLCEADMVAIEALLRGEADLPPDEYPGE